MDVVNSTPRRTAPARPEESGTRDPQRRTAEDENVRHLNAGQAATPKSSVDTRTASTKRQKPTDREHRAPLGPRPPEFASRRVISDGPVQLTTSPRRSQLPNTTSEPFLGLSARKKPTQPVAAQPVSSRPKDPKRAAAGRQVNMGENLTPEARARANLEERTKAHLKNGHSTHPKGGSLGISSVRPRNAALAAAQISSASASGTSIVTPLTVRTRKQSRPPTTGSDSLDIPQSRKASKSELSSNKPTSGIPSTASFDLNVQVPQTQGSTSVTRKTSNTRVQPQLSYIASTLVANDSVKNGHAAAIDNSRHQRLTGRQPVHRLATIPSATQEDLPRVSSAEQIQSKTAFGSGSMSSPSYMKDYAPSNGGLARAISPTDARRSKHTSEAIHSSAVAQRSPSPESLSGRGPSPSFVQRKSDSSSSPRVTPDGQQGFSIGQPLSSRSSYSSLRAPSSSLQHRTLTGGQSLRNVSAKSRNAHSPIGDLSEVVPPVPAIPKVYGSPRGPSEEQFYFNFDTSATPSNQGDVKGKRVAELTPPNVAQDYRHKRGATIASGLGTGSVSYHESAMHQPNQQMRLLPLNMSPLNKPAGDKIHAPSQRGPSTALERFTPPLAKRSNGTPTTPMTVASATASTHAVQHNTDDNKYAAARSLSAHYLPRSTSSGGSSAAIFVTPSPAASPAPFSPVGSLPGNLDVERTQRREKERNEMLSSNKSTEHTGGEAPAKYFRHFSKDISVTPKLSANHERTIPVGSPTPRNFSHAWNAGSSRISQMPQHFSDADPSFTTTSQEMSLAKAAASARRSVSMNPMPQVSLQKTDIPESNPRLPTIAAANTNTARINRVASQSTSLAARDALATHATTTFGARQSSSILAPVHKVLSSRPSLHALKRRQSDVSADKDEIAADEEMKKLASKRKDFENAAKELDELRRKATPKERISPSQAARAENLNIFERGEIIDYKDIYFCGLKTAKKFVGDLSSQAANFGFDDDRGDYNLVMGDHLAFRYEVIDILGKGSFGQVVRCIDHKTGGLVAVKIIRNKKRFHQQALVEVNILQLLREWDSNSQHSMVNFTQSFYFRGHLCISTELLDMNLYEFIKAHDFRGFSLKLIRRFTKQILGSLVLLQGHNVIHCDLKPENILLSHPLRSEIKVIDFGSSCFQNEKVYTYIQSRFYRSPEVLLGMNYGMPIDMWSLGCIIAELYTGYPIFPGENEQEQMACIMEVFGPPEKGILDSCTRRKLFFDSSGKPRPTVSTKGKRRRPNSKTLQQAIKCDDEAFLEFITRCLRWDPEKRLKPDEAMLHEFITGSKKRPRVPPVPLEGAISPTKRYNLPTPSKPRPLPDLPATITKPGSAVPGPSMSPVKNQATLRRHSTISGLPQNGISNRLSSAVTTAPTSALPRAIPRNVSGKSDLASAAALASIRPR